MDLKCDICFLNFDLDAHRPKNLPCGHTICQACVENPALGKKCPTCRKAFKIRRLEDLPDSFVVIRLLEAEDAPPCKKPKLEDPELEQLKRGADAGRKMVEMLRLVVPQAVESLSRQLESSVAQLSQVEQALERRVQREAAGDVGTTSDAVEEPLQLARQLEASHRLLTSVKCTVTAEEEGGSAWTASVEPGGCGDILRLLLLQLRKDGQLGKVDDAHAVPDGTAAPYVGPPLVCTLKITDKHLDNGRLKVADILRDVLHRWAIPRRLKNLHGEGSEDLLQVMGPHLEELEFPYNWEAQPSVMEEVEKMSGLKRLDVKCVQDVDHPDLPLLLEELTVYHMTENQLRCVERMPRLRSLQVLNYLGPNLTFPPSQHGRLL
ncbi:roquin-2-like [Frankliniella occidentalis]|uniref:Roquin-2-like n=1 Tax=Frankliniella occidentalis TaxID=133901 RepID=A0A9C6X825_FRAOC|nr:roquin-2-like [Frankliniella occidentalis]